MTNSYVTRTDDLREAKLRRRRVGQRGDRKRSAEREGKSGWHVAGWHPWESLQLALPLAGSELGTNTAWS